MNEYKHYTVADLIEDLQKYPSTDEVWVGDFSVCEIRRDMQYLGVLQIIYDDSGIG